MFLIIKLAYNLGVATQTSIAKKVYKNKIAGAFVLNIATKRLYLTYCLFWVIIMLALASDGATAATETLTIKS